MIIEYLIDISLLSLIPLFHFWAKADCLLIL